MKKCIYIFAAVLIANLTACTKNFLDVEDKSVILAEQYISDLPATQHYLNGIYALLGFEFYQSITQIYPDIAADNVKPASGITNHISLYNWEQQATAGNNLSAVWLYGYKVAGSCTFAIEKASNFESENPAKSRQIQAECYSLRALVHFTMVNMFAQSYNYTANGLHPGIPYKTTNDWNQIPARGTVQETYSRIIADLNKAIELFTSTQTNSLVMNKMAAKALLARVYLFKEDWLKAKELAKEVADQVPLMTGVLYPAKLFTLQETEALFQIAPSSNAALAGSYTTDYQGRYYNNGNLTRCLATSDISNLLRQDPQDKRSVWIKSAGQGKDTIVKYPVSVLAGITPVSASYYPTILRSSEMFLTVAEAAAKTGDDGTARKYLDFVRQRANASVGNSTVSGAALLDLIYLERRKELAFEGLRIFDLLRWKQDIKRSDPITPAVALLSYPSDRAIAPIPAIDAANGITQNPGY